MASTSNAIFPDTRLRNAFRDERDLPLHESSQKDKEEERLPTQPSVNSPLNYSWESVASIQTAEPFRDADLFNQKIY